MTQFKERLKTAIGDESPYSFAKKCGITESLLRKYLAGDSLPGLKKAVLIARAAGVSLDWLMAGEGSIRKGGTKEETGKHGREDDLVPIPLYSSAVIGQDRASPLLALSREYLAKTGLAAERLVLVIARGDSMEPTVRNGDLLLVDTGQRQPIEDTLYIVRMNELVHVKRLQRLHDGAVRMVSDNPAYAPDVVSKEHVQGLDIVGRVVWIGRRL